MQKFMAELGLSPASRSRVSAYPLLGPKPGEFGNSRFAGLLGPQERDEFFDD